MSCLHCVLPQLGVCNPSCPWIQLPGSREEEVTMFRLTGTKESA